MKRRLLIEGLGNAFGERIHFFFPGIAFCVIGIHRGVGSEIGLGQLDQSQSENSVITLRYHRLRVDVHDVIVEQSRGDPRQRGIIRQSAEIEQEIIEEFARIRGDELFGDEMIDFAVFIESYRLSVALIDQKQEGVGLDGRVAFAHQKPLDEIKVIAHARALDVIEKVKDFVIVLRIPEDLLDFLGRIGSREILVLLVHPDQFRQVPEIFLHFLRDIGFVLEISDVIVCLVELFADEAELKAAFEAKHGVEAPKGIAVFKEERLGRAAIAFPKKAEIR